jgi:hypothetical protein
VPGDERLLGAMAAKKKNFLIEHLQTDQKTLILGS